MVTFLRVSDSTIDRAPSSPILFPQSCKFFKFKKYFELRIQVDEITKDVSLIITDFGDDDDEVEEQKMFWENQIAGLKKVLGSR